MNTTPSLNPPVATAPRKPTWRFLCAHPAHLIALGFGSGLSPIAPGTIGTLWAWVAFAVLQPHMNDARWALLIGIGTLVGWWACTVTARHLAVADPGAIVWDEVLAFWLMLWLVTPASFWAQLWAFALFRAFDAAKPGPVAWADALFKQRRGMPIGWAQGFGILFDDFVAALCALLVIALWRFFVMQAFRPRVLVLAAALRERGLKLATAESCTGGLIAAACTAVAGSSDWFERGFVTYSNEAKAESLGVGAALIATHGAVSEPVARAMAEGALAHSKAQLAVAVTGIAGPGGGSAAKPVGTVWLAVARVGEDTRPELLQLGGDRAAIREQTVQRALQRLLERVGA